MHVGQGEPPRIFVFQLCTRCQPTTFSTCETRMGVHLVPNYLHRRHGNCGTMPRTATSPRAHKRRPDGLSRQWETLVAHRQQQLTTFNTINRHKK